MKASILQKCGLALVLALTPFLGGCDASTANSAPVNETVAQADQSNLSATGADSGVLDPNATPVDDAISTNADAVLENAEGKLISTPDTSVATVNTNPQLNDFVKLVQAGVGESVLLAYVTNSPSAFNVSSDDILYLNDLGTPEAVVSAMLQKDQQYNSTAGSATARAMTQPADTSLSAGPGPGAPPPAMANAEVQTPPLTPSADIEAEVQQAPNASYSYFYDSLSPYGSWVDISGYGPCWRPTVVVANPAWTPYSDRGHWAYTDCGWCWVSDYSWGWAPFHYGRWFRNAHYGWCWAPDTVWGPAWVSWRYSDAYCGWAPLPPSACYRPGFGFTYYGHSVGFGFTFGLSASHFTFVGMNHFHDRNPGRYRMEHREVTKIYNTTIINNQIIRGNNHNLINRGVPVERVAAATHQDIRPIRIRADADGPRSAQLGRDGRSLAVYRPELPTPRTAQAPRRVGEGVKPAPEFDLHSRVQQSHERAVAARTPTVNNAPGAANTPERRPIIGNQNMNRPDNVTRDNRDNRGGQPNNERPGSLIMRGANQPDRQTPVRDQSPNQTAPTELRHGPQRPPVTPGQPDRGDNNRRIVTPPMTPGGQGNATRPDRDNQPPANRPDIEQQQRQQRQLLQQQQPVLQQQQRDLQERQQRQQRDFQPQPVTPRQEAPARSFEVPRAQQPPAFNPGYQPPVRSEPSGTPRMQESRPAPPQQYSAPAPRQDGGGGRNDGGRGNGGGGNGNGNDRGRNDNGNGNGGRGNR